MRHLQRIESTLERAVKRAQARGAPPRLAAALGHAVFPGGARIRPQLCLAVAAACGDDAPELADASACALELLHCASLVHDERLDPPRPALGAGGLWRAGGSAVR
jgi:geranylgeranyl diphosphate synthase, type II